MLRGALFSALESAGADFSQVLDLYAGTGALGIEALSRGAAQATFVERDRGMCAVIRENLALTGFAEQAQVICSPAERALERPGEGYTLVLADPPYADTQARAVLEGLAASGKVEPGKTTIALEHSARGEPGAKLGPFTLVKTLKHGDTAVSLYR